LLKEYSQVIFDECHHAAADSAIEVLQEINAKYVYGVTATPKRGDGKEKINELMLGPVRYRFTAKDRAEEQNIAHLVYPRFTRTVMPHNLSSMPYGNDAYKLIRNNEVRDEQIIRDVVECIKSGRTPVVLTRFVDHAKKIASSPRLNSYKVNRLIAAVEKNQELGVKVTIVTWHPDAYKYGRSENRMELMEKLRKAGFEIRLVDDNCEHFAVIDKKIVWHGSVNLLSKEDVEDNLMRVCSEEIAAELLEISFGKGRVTQKW